MTAEKNTPNPIDIYVGSRLRLARTSASMSQEKLGNFLGVSFQQIQKYERGTNRIGPSRLYEASQFLDVPISFFFEGIPDPNQNTHHEFEKNINTIDIKDTKTLRILRDLSTLPQGQQKAIHSLIKSLMKTT